MPVFVWKGLDARGKEVKGMRDAESPRTLRTVLKKEGIRIIEQREEGQGTTAKTAMGKMTAGSLASTEVDIAKYFERITVADVALMTRQLATLLKSGITLIDALGALVDQVETEKLKKVFGAIRSGVNEGSSLANAMGQHPEVFDTLYISMIRAGEASGALDAVLIRLADFTEAQARLKSKVQSAMMYPLIMTGVGGIIMTILFVVVIPRITKIFTQVKADLPIQTKFLIFVADAIKGYWWLILIMMGIAVWLFRKWKATKKGRRIYDVWALKLPQIGAIVRLVAVARFSRTLATLLRAGVPVLTALDIVRDVLNNVRLAEVVADARDAIREGESIAEPLRRSKEFPPIVVHMIATGEKSGQLEHMLESVADNYDFQVDERVGRLTTLIEPIMIVGMGGAVAFVVWAILMPILSLSQHVNK